MSRWRSSAASSTSSAQIRLAISSSTCWPRNTIRCRSSRWNNWSPSGSSGASAVRARISATCPSLGVTPAMPSLTAAARRAASLTVPLLVPALCRTVPTVFSRPRRLPRRPFRPGVARGCRRRNNPAVDSDTNPGAAVKSPRVTACSLSAHDGRRAAGPAGRPGSVPGAPVFADGPALIAGLAAAVAVLAAVGVLGLGLGLGAQRGGRLDVHRQAGLVGDLHLLGEQPQRLAAQHLRHGHAELATVHDLLGEPVRRHPETVGLLHDVGVQLLLLHL